MKVIAVFKTHVDIGFTDLPRKVLAAYSDTLLTRIVEACERTRHTALPLVWTMPAFVLHYVLRNCSKELKERTEALIEADQLVWHALPFTLKAEFFSSYELRETLYYAKELCRVYNKPMPISAKMTDVPGHTQALVDSLCENGVKFLHLGCNPASTPPAVPRLFFWESNNKNRILTYYDRDYGGNVIPPKDWGYPVHLSMNVSADNRGVHEGDTLEKLQETLKSYDPTAELHVGTMDDFAKELLQCDLSALPVIRGELGDTWIAGLGAFPEGCAAIGEVREDFEKISMFLKKKGDTEFTMLQRTYLEKAMLFGEHSGGVDVKRLLSEHRCYEKSALLEALQTEPYLYANSGWDDERSWCFQARDAALQLKTAVKEKYRDAFDNSTQTSPPPSPFALSLQDDQIVISDRKSKTDIKISYLYEIIGRDTIDAYLDAYLTQKCDWALADFGRYQLDGTNTYPNVKNQTFTPTVKEIDEHSSSIAVTYTPDNKSFQEYGNAEQITIKATLSGDRIHVSIYLKNKQPTMYVEGGYLCFEFGESIKNIALYKSGVKINPGTDIVSGANTALFAVNPSITVNEISITPMHTPLVCFGEPKIYRNNTQKFRMPQNGKVFFNLFNNMWASGSPQWIAGSYHFEFFIDKL